MTTRTKRPMSSQAQAAATIRTELKAAYPHTTFRVKSESFSGGDSVHIGWTDGPTDDQVTDLTAKYQYGHFDGMDDLYHYSNNRDDISQSKYVSTHRSYSKETFAHLVAYLNTHYGYALVVDDRTGFSVTHDSDAFAFGSGWQSQDIYRTFSRMSLVCPTCTHVTAPRDQYCGECGTALTT